MTTTIKTATIKCVGKRMSGGHGHEHISHLWWVRCEDGRETSERGNSTREQMVAYIEANGNESVWCPDRNPQLKGAWVHVHSNGRIKYVQTVADGRKTDNLLSLPDL
ncbi:MAG: DUF3892 domain-containing protein [Variovorax sp.]